METQFSGFRGLDDGVFTVVLLLVLDDWNHSDLAVKSSVVEPVDVLGDGDLDVVDALNGAMELSQQTPVRPIDPVKPRLDPIGANAWGAPLVDDFHLEGSRHRFTFGRNCRPSPQG